MSEWFRVLRQAVTDLAFLAAALMTFFVVMFIVSLAVSPPFSGPSEAMEPFVPLFNFIFVALGPEAILVALLARFNSPHRVNSTSAKLVNAWIAAGSAVAASAIGVVQLYSAFNVRHTTIPLEIAWDPSTANLLGVAAGLWIVVVPILIVLRWSRPALRTPRDPGP